MNQKRVLLKVVFFKLSFFLLIVSVVIFPRFVWKLGSTINDVHEAGQRGDKLDVRNDIGITPLMGAAAEGQVDAVKYLLRRKADMYKKAKNPDDIILKAGNTALHYACLWGHAEVIKLFVKRGVFEPIKGIQATPVNDNEDTPLQLIIASEASTDIKKECMATLFGGDEDIIKLLINYRNKQGYTPLMRAAEQRSPDLVKYLLENWGKNIFFNLVNKNGETARGVAYRDAADDSIKRMIREAEIRWSR